MYIFSLGFAFDSPPCSFHNIADFFFLLFAALPKADSVFEVLIPKPEGIMQICGNAFISRPAERSSKKIKSFIDLIGPKAHRKALLQQKVQPVDQ